MNLKASEPLKQARAQHLKKCARWNLPASAHFDAGWKARQSEIDQLNSFIKSLANTCEEAEKIAGKCIRGECAAAIRAGAAEKEKPDGIQT